MASDWRQRLAAYEQQATHDGFVQSLDVVSQVIASVGEATTRTAEGVIRLAEAMEQEVRGSGPLLLDAHEALAEQAQAAVVESYDTWYDRKHAGAYRADSTDDRFRRYAGGLMKQALSDPGLIVATEHGIDYARVSVLDRYVRQWARLNFGAGGKAGGGSPRFAVTFSDLQVATLGFDNGPRPAFKLPPGFVIGSGAEQQFYPTQEYLRLRGRSKLRPRPRRVGGGLTSGIEGEHFLDAGLEVIAKGLGPAYNTVNTKLFEAAKERARVGAEELRYTARPRRFSSKVL